MFEVNSLFRKIIIWFIKKIFSSDTKDKIGISDSITIILKKDGKIIERRTLKGHTWLSNGLIYVRDCLRISGSKVPVSSMSAWGNAGENWAVTDVDDFGASPYYVKWHAGWGTSGAITIDAFKISPGGGTIYSSIGVTQFIKTDGVSLDTYYTSTVTTS